MGIVAEHIRKKLVEDIRTKGLLIWLDKDHEFTHIVDTWIQEREHGTFPYDIYAFRGSFLELMIESQEILSGKIKPKCVIHMPGFNEQDIKKTPLLESYKAGQRWRISLETIIREVAQGRLSEQQLTYLMGDKTLSLEEAEAFLHKEEDIPKEIQDLLKKYGEEGLVLRFIDNPVATAQELRLDCAHAFTVIGSYFETLIGLDEHWKNRWDHLSSDFTAPETQIELLLSYLMALEFVHDLKVMPKSERLTELKKKPKEYVRLSLSIVRQMRENTPDMYMKWADRVAANLTEAESSHTAAELGNIDTFRFEADIVLRHAMNLLENNQWTKALKIAETRIPPESEASAGVSFWLRQDKARKWLWTWIEKAARLAKRTEEVEEEIPILSSKNPSLEDIITSYTESWYSLDRMHRQFALLSERYQALPSGLHIQSFVEIRLTLQKKYREIIDRQAVLWNRTCEENGFLPSEDLQQRYFYDRWMHPKVGKGKKLAVFFVDALRFELGKYLSEKLQEISPNQKVYPLVAELPTITSVGMNVLAPVVENSRLTPAFDSTECIIGFVGGQRQVKDPKQRHKTFEEKSGTESSWIKSLSDLLSMDEKSMAKISSKEVIYISALDIDKMGESGALSYGLDYFEQGVGRIKQAVEKLRGNGFEEFIITADHGFLLGDESLRTGEAPRLEHVDRRYAFDVPRKSETLVTADSRSLGYEIADTSRGFVFPRSTHILTNVQKAFYHGGNSLQERIIPVILLEYSNEPADKTGTFELAIQKKQDAFGFHRVTVTPQVRDNLLFLPETIEMQMTAEASVGVEIHEMNPGTYTGNLLSLPVGKEIEIFFKLNGGNAPKVRISFTSVHNRTILRNTESSEYFEVQNAETTPVTPSGKRADEPVGKGFSPEIPAEFHAALIHLQHHGSLTEAYLINTLGGGNVGARKARRFASRIDAWLSHLPFNIYIEETSEGKVYKKREG